MAGASRHFKSGKPLFRRKNADTAGDQTHFVSDSAQPSLRVRVIEGGKGAAPNLTISEGQIQQALHQAAALEPAPTEPVATVEAHEEHTEALTGAGIIDRLQLTINNPNLDLRMLQVTDRGMSVEAFAQSIIDRYSGAERTSPDAIRKNARQYREAFQHRLTSLRSISNIEALSTNQVKQLKDDVSRGIVATVLGALAERIEASGTPVDATPIRVEDTIPTMEMEAIHVPGVSTDETPTISGRPTANLEHAANPAMEQIQQLQDERAQLLVDTHVAELPIELDQPIDEHNRDVENLIRKLVGEKEHELRQQSADGSYMITEEGEAELDKYEQSLRSNIKRITALYSQIEDLKKEKPAPVEPRVETSLRTEASPTPEQPMTPKDLEQRRQELLAYFNMSGLKEPVNPNSLLFRTAKKELRNKAIRDFQAQGLEGEALRERMEQFETNELNPRADELLLVDQSLQDRGLLSEQDRATRLGISTEHTPSMVGEVPKKEIAALQQRREEIMNELDIRHQDNVIDTNSTEWKVMVEDVVGRYSLDHADRTELDQYRRKVNDLGKELETIDYRLGEAGAALVTESLEDGRWFNTRPQNMNTARANRAKLQMDEKAATIPNTPPVPSTLNINPSAERQQPAPRAAEATISSPELQAMEKKLGKLQHTIEELMKDEEAILATFTGWRALMAKVKTPAVLQGVRRQMERASQRASTLTAQINAMKQEVQQPAPAANVAYAEIVPEDERPPIIETSLLDEVLDDELEVAPAQETPAQLRERRLAILTIFGLDNDKELVQSTRSDRKKLRDAASSAGVKENLRLRDMAMRQIQRGTPRINESIAEDMYKYERWLTAKLRELLEIEKKLQNAEQSAEKPAA